MPPPSAPPSTQSQSYIQGPLFLPRILTPLDPNSYTHTQISPSSQPYSYRTLLLHGFVISVFLLAVPLLMYWMFVHCRKWINHRARDHPGGGVDEERLSGYRVSCGGNGEEEGGGDVGVDGAVGATGNLVATMKNMLWGSLRGITRPMTQGGAYATLPLPAVQFKRTEVKRGKTLQQGSQGGWESSRSGYGRYGGIDTGGRIGNHNAGLGNRRAVSGPYLYGLYSGWGRDTKSTEQQLHQSPSAVLGIHPPGEVGPVEYGSITTSSTMSSISTLRKRSSGIPAVEIESTQFHSAPQAAPRTDYQFHSWDAIPLGDPGNCKIPGYSRKRVSSKPDGRFSGSLKRGASSAGFIPAGNNRDNLWNQSHGVLQEIGRNDRDGACVGMGGKGEPQREHWWQGLMKEFKQSALNREEDQFAGSNVHRSGGNQKRQTHQAQARSIPPTKISRKFANIDNNGNNAPRPKYYMRGARNEESFDGRQRSRRIGWDEARERNASEDEDSSSESIGNDQRIRGRSDRCRYDGGDDSPGDLVSINLIAPSQSTQNEQNGQTEESPEQSSSNDPATTFSIKSALPLKTRSPRDQPVVVGGNTSGSSTNGTVTSQSVSPPSGIPPTHNMPTVLPSSSSIVFETTPLMLKPRRNSLAHCSPCPLPTPADALTIRNYISHPTRHLFFNKVFEPHMKEYGQFILPPLSRVLYARLKKHSTTLYQQEPSIEEGWRLGIGDGRRDRDRWLRLRSGPCEGQGVDRLLPQRRCSDPGVRRCVGRMWMQAVGLATAVQLESGEVKRVVRQRENEPMLGRAGLGRICFPEWFSPGWGSEDEEVYRLLHDAGSDIEEASDTDVDIVLKHVARAKRREITELLREFSEEMFLKEVDARLEWWWWQARGSGAGLAGREAERRRDLLLLQEGRKCSDLSPPPPEMQKQYFDTRFPLELEEGEKWGNWKLEMDVPGGVRDAGTFCFPKPPQGNGTLYKGEVGKMKSVSIPVKCGHDNMGGLGRMVNRARWLMGGEEKIRQPRKKGYEVVKIDSVCFGGDGSGDRPEEAVSESVIASSTPLNDDPQFLCLDAVESIRSGGENMSSHHDSATIIARHSITSLNSGSISASSQSRSRGKGMTILLQQRRRRRRDRTSLANGSLRIRAPLTGKKVGGQLRLSVGSAGSAGSGYIAGDEDTGILSSLSLLPGFELGKLGSCSKPQSRVPSWGTDKSGDSMQSAGSVESVSSGYGGEWGWSRLGVRKRRRSKGNEISKNDGELESADYEVTWEGMEPSVVQDDDGLLCECSEEEEQTDLIPEDVRGSWGRNGGYLGLGVVKAASEGKRINHRRAMFAELEVSAPELGYGSCRRRNHSGMCGIQSLPVRRQQQSFTSLSLSSGCEGYNPPPGSGNQPPPPWFMNLRSLRVPESTGSESSGMKTMGGGSSAVAIAAGGDGAATSSVVRLGIDKEQREMDRMREVGKRVREVGTDRGRGLKVGICTGMSVTGGRRVVSEPVQGGGEGVEREKEREREREREFWTRRIGRNVDLLFGPVNSLNADG